MAQIHDLVSYRQSYAEFLGYMPPIQWIIGIPIIAAVKMFRIPLSGGASDDPPVDEISDLEITSEELPQKARDKTWELQEQLEQLGFQPSICYSMYLPNQRSEIYQIFLLHPTDSVIARISYRHSYQLGKHRLFVSFISSNKSGESVLTTNGCLDSLYPSKVHVVRKVREPIAKLLDRHHQAVQDQGLAPLKLTKGKHVAQVIEYLHKKHVQFQLERGVYAPLREDSSEAERLTNETGTELSQHTDVDEPTTGSTVGQDRVTAEIVQTMIDETTKSTSWKQNFILLVISLGAFVAFSHKQDDWTWTALLIPVLFIHELGHLIMMQACGYRNTKIFFIPGFGAAASGINFNVAGWKRVVVALAGPLVGLSIGGLVGVAGVVYSIPILTKFGIVSGILNLFNLLPVLPLDGGWLAFHLLFCRHPALDAAFRACGALCLFGLAIVLNAVPLGIVAFFILMGAFRSFKIGDVARRLREEGLQPASDEQHGVNREIAYRVATGIRTAFQSNKQIATKLLANYSLEAYSLLHARPPRWLGSLFFSAVHVSSVLVGFVGVLFLSIADTPNLQNLFRVAFMNAAFRNAGLHQPTHDYQCGSTKNWAGANSADFSPKQTVLLIVRLDSAEQANQQFERRQKDLSATSRLTCIAPYLLFVLPADDEPERERLIQSLTQDKVKFAIAWNDDLHPYMDLLFELPDLNLAESVEQDLRVFSDLGDATGLIPPWAAAWQAGGPQIEEYKKSRRTYLAAQKADRESYLHQERSAELGKELQEAQRLGRRPRVKELQKQLHEASKEARFKALDGLLENVDESLDRETMQLYVAWRKELEAKRTNANPENIDEEEEIAETGHQDQTETYRALRNRLGSIAENDTELLRLAAKRIAVHRLKNSLACRFTQFESIETGLPGLADWLCAKGANQLKFDIHSTGLPQ